MRYFLIVIILINILSMSAKDYDYSFDRLDSLVANRDYFIDRKKNQLSSLKQLYVKTGDLNARYDIGSEIFKLYSKFDRDSAVFYARANYATAMKINDKDKVASAKMNYVFMMAASGMYKECFDYMPRFTPDEYSSEVKYQYYKLYEYIYQGLQVYSSDSFSRNYTSVIDSIYGVTLSALDSTSYEYRETLARRAFNNKDFNSSISLIYDCLPYLSKGTNEYAMVLYMLANAYKETGDEDNYLRYITEVVEVDIRTAVREYRALTELAEFLYQKGDIERAYTYSRRSLEDAEIFNARQHTLEVARIQPIINDAYQKRIKEGQMMFRNLSFVLAGCMILLLLAVVFIVHQIRQLRKANKEKEGMIVRLSEVNHVKEEYIGHFMKLCSEYIVKLDDFRKLVNRKLKSGQYDDLYKFSSSKKSIDKEQEELYRKFDTSFLQLYPNFVSDVNLLLKEELRFELKKDELLNTELRICALIKLGVKDSAKISEFLGYSPNSIYTYRTKVRNRAVNRDTFEKDIAEIGDIS